MGCWHGKPGGGCCQAKEDMQMAHKIWHSAGAEGPEVAAVVSGKVHGWPVRHGGARGGCCWVGEGTWVAGMA